ncbi:methylosome subunit pICln-like [Diorhabda carinulata]|uniref:methylosome subunit pICln-like n=1 Tax=Diorhabda sublineata TaxID=1163346 RepID=UPI0024E0C8DF|nr:methylosome subunit pICln-like [Diorhabda sublineata]XP_057655683.1 methylosome subunit pICln-like [Diorhabda carinulata]
MVIINSFRYPESDIKCEHKDVRVFLDKKDLGLGTLIVSERTFCWHQREDIGFSISYSSISLHAISKDANVHPNACVYVMIDGHFTMPGDVPPEPETNDDSDVESEPDISEIIVVPENEELIQEIYNAITLCQELNPDPMDEVDESDDNDDNLYEDAEDDMEDEENEIRERGGGDADIDDLARRIQANSVDLRVNYRNGHNDDDDFQDAD